MGTHEKIKNHNNFRTWKSGKKWLYAATALSVVIGGGMELQTLIDTNQAFAETIGVQSDSATQNSDDQKQQDIQDQLNQGPALFNVSSLVEPFYADKANIFLIASQKQASIYVDEIDEILDAANAQADVSSTDAIQRNLAIVALNDHIKDERDFINNFGTTDKPISSLNKLNEKTAKLESVLSMMKSEVDIAEKMLQKDKDGVDPSQVRSATAALSKLILPDDSTGYLSAYGDLIIATKSTDTYQAALRAIDQQGLTSQFRYIVDPIMASVNLTT
ncbi:MAG: KxYKxGKxW signal peptide domain-containing protein, partial [Lactobacillaceae bacterium]|nr:KxYKxGKxW signal peptide domain-containing protein [Lactobacillaceae bacterium]